MKLFKSAIFVALMALAMLFAAEASYGPACLCAFIGLANLHDWTAYRPGVYSANIIADDLQLTRVLDNAIVGLKQALLPLRTMSTAAKNVPVGNETGENSVTVPVYDFTSAADADVKDRTPGTDYRTLVSDTSTSARKIIINKEKVVGISFTNEEASLQVAFDPVMHGQIKGRKLAEIVLKDIASKIRYGVFPNATLAPTLPANFDQNDVADLAQLCMEANWGQLPQPGLVLNPGMHFNLVKQPALLYGQNAGNTDALRDATINDIMGFSEAPTNALPLNNGTGQTFTAATTDIITRAAHGYLTGDQVQVSSATTLPAGLSAATYYYVIKLTADTFKLSTTLAGAVAGTGIVDITDTGTGTHTVTLKTNLIGFAGHPSAIITGFRPVLPTAGIRQKLINFELVDDEETGLTLEYRHIADENTGEEFQLIGVRYGYEYGLAAALKLISSPAA